MKTLQRILTLVLFLTITTATAKAGEWKLIKSTAGTNYYINTNIIHDKYGVEHVVWAKVVYLNLQSRVSATKKYNLERTVYSTKYCFKYNEIWSQESTTAIIHYDKDDGVIDSYNDAYALQKMVVPETIEDMAAEAAKLMTSSQKRNK